MEHLLSLYFQRVNMTYEAYNRVKPHRDALPADVDLTFYEFNTHTSHGDAPAGDFALLTPSLAQGIALANYSLVNDAHNETR